MALYLKEAADLLRDDPRVDCFFTAPRSHWHKTIGTGELAKIVQLPAVSYYLARLRWWDLIIVPDHGHWFAFDPRIPAIFMTHALTSAKLVDGRLRRYDRLYTFDGTRPIYARMLEASEDAKRKAVAQDPAMESIVSVVGDLRVDRMLRNRARRMEIRAAFGFGDQDRVVLIQSTWGPTSLMSRFGESLLNEAVRLSQGGRWRFIISVHPNNWGDSDYARQNPYGAIARRYETAGVRVIDPKARWEEYMIAADMAVSDHSSMAPTFAVLDKPILFVPLIATEFADTSFVARLSRLTPPLKTISDLESRLDEALTHYPLPEHRTISSAIANHRGEAAQRVRREVDAILFAAT